MALTGLHSGCTFVERRESRYFEFCYIFSSIPPLGGKCQVELSLEGSCWSCPGHVAADLVVWITPATVGCDGFYGDLAFECGSTE